jgi:hypothetical protein
MALSRSAVRETYRKLVAYRSGGNIDRFEHKHLHIHDNPVLVSFVRLGGLNLPIGAVFGRARDHRLVTVSVKSLEDATNLTKIAEVFQDLAEYFLEEFGVGPTFSTKPLPKKDEEVSDLNQVWLPDKANFEMLKNFEIAYFEEPNDSPTAMGTFARLCGFLFESSALSGDHLSVVASSFLNDTHVLAIDDQLSSNLAACLAFLSDISDEVESKTKAAIRAALQHNGMTLAKNVEDSLLELTDPLEFQSVLVAELDVRGELLRRAWQTGHILDNRKPNSAAATFALESANRFREFLGAEFHENSGAPRIFREPISDLNQLDAAKRFIDLQAAEQRYEALMVHDDQEILQELVHRGDAFFGVCERVEKLEDGSTAWFVRLNQSVGGLFKRRESSGFCLIGKPSNDVATLESFDKSKEEWLLKLVWNQIQIQDSTISEQQDNPIWHGKTVIFVPKFDNDTYERQRKALKFATSSPGKWILEEVKKW